MTPEDDRLADWVAKIVRAAEDAALERAAMVPSGQAIRKGLVGSPEFMQGWDTACWHIAAAIRALKHDTDAPRSRGWDSGGAARDDP